MNEAKMWFRAYTGLTKAHGRLMPIAPILADLAFRASVACHAADKQAAHAF